MKDFSPLLLIMLTLSIFSCSKNENSTSPAKESIVVYKKAEVHNGSNLLSSQEVFYNENKKVEKIVTNIDKGWKISTLEVFYEDNQINKIIKIVDYDGTYGNNDVTEKFDVHYEGSEIILASQTGPSNIYIGYTDDYVDYFKRINASTGEVSERDIFKRNSDNNIISHSTYTLEFTYSNYDIGNNLPFFRESSIDFFIPFGLKVSDKLPLTETTEQAAGNSSESILNASLLTYDAHNNIIRYGDNSYYTIYEYSEL